MTTMAKEEYKTVTYPIPHDENGGSLFLFGKPSSNRIILMCAGFPDDHSSMIPLARRFSLFSQCFVGVTCLPGFDKIRYKEGYTFQEWVYSLREATKVLRAHSRRRTAKLTFIFHDWACIAGQLLTTRLLEDGFEDLIPDEIVLLDVCMPLHPSVDISHLQIHFSFIESLYTYIALFAYSVTFATAFWISYYSSPDMAVFWYLAGWKIQMWMGWDPFNLVDSNNIASRYLTLDQHHLMYMTYPHYYYWRNILLRSGELETCHLPIDLEKTPVLYIYGQDKNVMFHNATTLAVLDHEFMECRRSKAVAVPNAGHWLHVQQEEVCFQEIVKFLNNTCVRFSPIQTREARR